MSVSTEHVGCLDRRTDGGEVSTFLISSHMSAAVKSREPDGPIVKDGQTLTRTPSVSWDAIANVTGGCPPAVLHWRQRQALTFTQLRCREDSAMEDQIKRTCGGGERHGRRLAPCKRHKNTFSTNKKADSVIPASLIH
jgi:hypothetical protein